MTIPDALKTQAFDEIHRNIAATFRIIEGVVSPDFPLETLRVSLTTVAKLAYLDGRTHGLAIAQRAIAAVDPTPHRT